MTGSLRLPVVFSQLDGHERIVLLFSGGKDSIALASVSRTPGPYRRCEHRHGRRQAPAVHRSRRATVPTTARLNIGHDGAGPIRPRIVPFLHQQ